RVFFFFQAEDGIRVFHVTGVQTCALPIYDADCPTLQVDRGDEAGHRAAAGTVKPDLLQEDPLLALKGELPDAVLVPHSAVTQEVRLGQDRLALGAGLTEQLNLRHAGDRERPDGRIVVRRIDRKSVV